MLNEVLHLTNGAPFAQLHENGEIISINLQNDTGVDIKVKSCSRTIKINPNMLNFFGDDFSKIAFQSFIEAFPDAVINRFSLNTSCFGCKYDDCEVDEEERKANCLSCLEPVTIRKNFVWREDALHVKDK